MSENGRYRDFDQFWAEKTKDPVRVKVFGETVDLPASLPASLMLFTIRAHAACAQEMTPEAVIKMSESMFGKERLERWVDQGITVDQLGDLLKWSISQYAPGKSDDSGN